YKIKWLSDMNLNTENAKYAAINLTWDTARNLDLFLVYADGPFIYETRFSSEHENNQLGEYWEKIEKADIRYYMDKYGDVGIEVYNADSEMFFGNFTVKVNLKDVKEQDNVTINLHNIATLGPYASRNFTLRVNGSRIKENKTNDFLLVVENSSQEISWIPIRIKTTQTTITSTTSTSTTSTSTTTIPLPADVVINEFMPNPNGTSEWVELYNKGGSAQNLINWSIAGQALSGTLGISGWTYFNFTSAILNNTGDTIILLNDSSGQV
ncbi:unnamed protein product, partial [marine sediment metagenome]